MRDLKDKRVLITGAANGIGHALVRAFADEGSRLLLVRGRIIDFKHFE